MMNSQNISTVQTFNNHGVSLLADGHCEAAIVEFSGALKLARQIMTSCEITNDDDDEELTSSRVTLDECMMKSLQHKDMDMEITDVDNASAAYIYEQATIIPDGLLKDNNNGQTLPIIIIFNLALAHQKRGPSSSKLMEKAIKFYELAFCLYQEDQTRNADILFYMALMNNLALAHQALQDMVAARECFQQLLSVIMLVTDTGNHPLTSSVCDGFLRNVSHLVSPHATAPAA